jgi:hypothetical protein
MGLLLYGRPPEEIDIDDRTLAHLKIVILTKLRRGERFPFSFEYENDGGRSTVWLHYSIPLQFKFEESHQPIINRAWIDALAASANSVDGLRVLTEPPASDAA